MDMVAAYLEPIPTPHTEQFDFASKWWPWATFHAGRSRFELACRPIHVQFRITTDPREWHSSFVFLEQCVQDTIDLFISELHVHEKNHPRAHPPKLPVNGHNVIGPSRRWSLLLCVGEETHEKNRKRRTLGYFPVDSSVLDDAYCTWRMVFNDILCSNKSYLQVERRRLLMNAKTVDFDLAPLSSSSSSSSVTAISFPVPTTDSALQALVVRPLRLRLRPRLPCRFLVILLRRRRKQTKKNQKQKKKQKKKKKKQKQKKRKQRKQRRTRKRHPFIFVHRSGRRVPKMILLHRVSLLAVATNPPKP